MKTRVSLKYFVHDCSSIKAKNKLVNPKTAGERTGGGGGGGDQFDTSPLVFRKMYLIKRG